MKEQALELAKEFDELAEISYEMVLRSESDSPIAQQLTGLHVKYAKDHQRNAQLLRDLVDELDKQENRQRFIQNFAEEQHRRACDLERSLKPLSDEEIEGAFYKKCWYYDEDEKFDYYGFAREIEKRHGIK